MRGNGQGCIQHPRAVRALQPGAQDAAWFSSWVVSQESPSLWIRSEQHSGKRTNGEEWFTVYLLWFFPPPDKTIRGLVFKAAGPFPKASPEHRPRLLACVSSALLGHCWDIHHLGWGEELHFSRWTHISVFLKDCFFHSISTWSATVSPLNRLLWQNVSES